MPGEEYLADLKASVASKSERLPEESLKALLYHLIRIARGSHAVSWRKFIKFKICSKWKPREKIAAKLEQVFLKYQDEFNNHLACRSLYYVTVIDSHCFTFKDSKSHQDLS